MYLSASFLSDAGFVFLYFFGTIFTGIIVIEFIRQIIIRGMSFKDFDRYLNQKYFSNDK